MPQVPTTSLRWTLCLSLLDGLLRVATAQGPTSAAIAGRVLDDSGRGLSGVDVVVTNRATGISMHAVSRAQGRYLVGGLEVGGPYSVTVRRLGSPVLTRDGLFLRLGQRLQIDLPLVLQAVRIEGVETVAAQDRVFSRAHMGAETFLSDSTIHQMPVINRDLYDLVRLVPQTSTWFPISLSTTAGRRG